MHHPAKRGSGLASTDPASVSSTCPLECRAVAAENIFSSDLHSPCSEEEKHAHDSSLAQHNIARQSSVQHSLEATRDAGSLQGSDSSRCLYAEARGNDFRGGSPFLYLKSGPTKEDSKDLGDLYADEGLGYESTRNDDLLQQETGWIALAQASNDAPEGAESQWRLAAGAHDACNSSTSASDKSEKRKRRSNSSEDEASLKPYECRFCPMKFAKSQALGGHMNRHRQEREREQLIHARQLVMQQGFSSLTMPGDNNCPPSSLPKYHGQRQRSADPSFKYGMRFSAPGAAMFTGTQSGTYTSSALPTTLHWNLGALLGSSQNTASTLNPNPSGLDAVVPLLQTTQPYGAPQLNSVMPYMMQQSNRAASGQGILGMPYERNMQGSSFPFDSSALQMNPYAIQRSSMQTQRQRSQAEDTVPRGDLTNLLPATNIASGSSLQFEKSDVMKSLSQAASLQHERSQQFNLAPISSSRFMSQSSGPFYSYPAEGIRTTTSQASQDFIGTPGNQLDGLQWLFGNQKIPSAVSPLSNEEYNQVHDSDANLSETALTVIGQPRSPSADFAPRSNASDTIGRLKDQAGPDF